MDKKPLQLKPGFLPRREPHPQKSLTRLCCASQQIGPPMTRSGQTRTSSLGAARPLPPSADIGPGGQSVGQAAQFCLGPPRRGRQAGRLSQPPLATTNKCLAQNNKSRRVIRATKDRHEWASTVADMSERYPLVYRLLKDAGHDPAKAVELLLDAKRGDEWALIWIRVLRRNRKG